MLCCMSVSYKRTYHEVVLAMVSLRAVDGDTVSPNPRHVSHSIVTVVDQAAATSPARVRGMFALRHLKSRNGDS